MKLEVGQRIEYDPNHPHCCFVTIPFLRGESPTITIMSIKGDIIEYIYENLFISYQHRRDFIRALTPLSSLEKELL